MKLPWVVFSWSIVFTLIFLLGAFVLAIIFYRIALIFAFTTVDQALESHYSILIASTSAVINLIFIVTFNYLYKFAAKWLTEKELQRAVDWDAKPVSQVVIVILQGRQ